MCAQVRSHTDEQCECKLSLTVFSFVPTTARRQGVNCPLNLFQFKDPGMPRFAEAVYFHLNDWTKEFNIQNRRSILSSIQLAFEISR